MTRLDNALDWLRQSDQHVTTAALNLAKAIDTAADMPTLIPLAERPEVRDYLSIYRGALAERVSALDSLITAQEQAATVLPNGVDLTTAPGSARHPSSAAPGDADAIARRLFAQWDMDPGAFPGRFDQAVHAVRAGMAAS
jgi:hypothetical protein